MMFKNLRAAACVAALMISLVCAACSRAPEASDAEDAVRTAIEAAGGEAVSIQSVQAQGTNGESFVVLILTDNEEEAVRACLDGLSAVIAGEENGEVVFTVGDRKLGNEAPALLSGMIRGDGEIVITQESLDYNTPRNIWVREQFRDTDGAHMEVERLVLEGLSDPDSYEHMQTIYRDVRDETIRDEANHFLEEAGYPDRVEVGDLFIQLHYSAEEDGRKVKHIAYGIADYQKDEIRLIDIK